MKHKYRLTSRIDGKFNIQVRFFFFWRKLHKPDGKQWIFDNPKQANEFVKEQEFKPEITDIVW
jgi:hypothetical protein